MNKLPVFHLRRPNLKTALFLTLATGPVLADIPSLPTTPPLNNHAVPNLSRETTFDLPAVATTPVATTGTLGTNATVTLRRIVFRGHHALSTTSLNVLAQPYLNRPLNMDDLENLRQGITRHYVAQGYVNSGAVLGTDALHGDTLTLDIIEGRIVALRIQGLERLQEGYVLGRLVPDEKEALNIDRLRERFQRLLDDPLFERINARLTPGGQLGEAILDVDVVRARPYTLSIAANNYRPPSIGETAFNINSGVRNLTGFGDQLDLNLQHADGTVGRSGLSWQMPLGSRGTRLSLQLDHGRSSVIEEPLQVLDIKSTLDSKEFGLSQTIHETLRDRVTLGGQRVWRKNRTELLGLPFSFVAGEPNGMTRTRSWRFWQEYTHRTEQDALALRSTFNWVRNNLQDTAGLPVSGTQPAHSYLTWLGQAQYTRQIHAASGTQLILRGALQTTSRHLLALDQFSIGGITTVRGYRENLMLRDRGATFNIEVDYPLIRTPGNGLNLSIIPFYDAGFGRNKNDTSETISSIGIALRHRWQGSFVDLAVAHRLTYPEAIKTLQGSLQDKAVHLQMGYRFY